MEEAMKAVQKGDIEAAREYGVPRTTLKDQVSGRVKHGSTKSGPQPYLSVDEETKQFQLQMTLHITCISPVATPQSSSASTTSYQVLPASS